VSASCGWSTPTRINELPTPNREASTAAMARAVVELPPGMVMATLPTACADISCIVATTPDT
jgi:hypothetical protein